MANDRILTAEQEMKLRQPIDDYIGKIQEQIDSLRKDGTDQVVSLQNDHRRGKERPDSYKRGKRGPSGSASQTAGNGEVCGSKE